MGTDRALRVVLRPRAARGGRRALPAGRAGRRRRRVLPGDPARRLRLPARRPQARGHDARAWCSRSPASCCVAPDCESVCALAVPRSPPRPTCCTSPPTALSGSWTWAGYNYTNDPANTMTTTAWIVSARLCAPPGQGPLDDHRRRVGLHPHRIPPGCPSPDGHRPAPCRNAADGALSDVHRFRGGARGGRLRAARPSGGPAAAGGGPRRTARDGRQPACTSTGSSAD